MKWGKMGKWGFFWSIPQTFENFFFEKYFFLKLWGMAIKNPHFPIYPHLDVL